MVRQPGDRLKGIPLENDDDDDQHDVDAHDDADDDEHESVRIKSLRNL